MTINGGSAGAADALVEALLATGRVMIGLTARSLAQFDTDITMSQYRMLVTLAAKGPQRTTDLATELGVSPSTVSRTCDRLVRRELAQRFQRDDDRRAAWIALTETGKTLIGAVMRQRRADVTRLAESARLTRADPRTSATAGALAHALAAFVSAAGELPEPQWWQRWEVATGTGNARVR